MKWLVLKIEGCDTSVSEGFKILGSLSPNRMGARFTNLSFVQSFNTYDEQIFNPGTTREDFGCLGA